MPLRDEDIIAYVLKGKGELFSILVERYQTKVYSTAYNYTHDREEAMDLTQEVFIKVYNNLHSYKSKALFSTWLYRITVNRCIDWTRKKRLQTVSALQDGEDETGIYDTIVDSSWDPEETVVRQEDAESIRAIVEELPEIYKTAIILYYFEDFSPKEIAEIIEVPRRTVETRLFRAKNMLKLRLEKLRYGGENYGLR